MIEPAAITAMLTGACLVIAQVGTTYVMLRNAREARESRAALARKFDSTAVKVQLIEKAAGELQGIAKEIAQQKADGAPSTLTRPPDTK